MMHLTKRQILITRPEPHGTELCSLINTQGDSAVSFPTIVFGPPPNRVQFERSIALLGQQDWLIFISPQAVYAIVPSIRKMWPHLPASVKFAAVGAKTAQLLIAAGYEGVTCPSIAGSSEALLELPIFQHVPGKKMALISGAEGLDLLDQKLKVRGACVLPVIAYQRRRPTVDVAPTVLLIKNKEIDVIVCTSFTGVQNLKILLSECWLFLKDVPLIVVSERIKRLAHDLGFQTIWVAAGASHEAIIKILAQLKGIDDDKKEGR
jgi:uroporphyrinogen-III synthase